MRHCVVSISYHRQILQLKLQTQSMLTFSVTLTLLFQRGVRISPLGESPPTLPISVVSYRIREKQLLCMARAILKRTKVLVMDEVCVLSDGGQKVDNSLNYLAHNRQPRGTKLCMNPIYVVLMKYSVDYATDELIGKTIKQ